MQASVLFYGISFQIFVLCVVLIEEAVESKYLYDDKEASTFYEMRQGSLQKEIFEKDEHPSSDEVLEREFENLHSIEPEARRGFGKRGRGNKGKGVHHWGSSFKDKRSSANNQMSVNEVIFIGTIMSFMANRFTV